MPPLLTDLRKRADRLLGEYVLASRQVKQERTALREAIENVSAALEAQQVVQAASKATQEQAHRSIADVVSKCLEAVFGEESYEFVVKFHQKRGKTEAELLFRRDGQEISPMKASGGGAIDIASFALRLAALMLSTPRKRKLLVMDEPFRFLSKQYRASARQLLKTLAEETGIQFIMVTHVDEFRIGSVVELD